MKRVELAKTRVNKEESDDDCCCEALCADDLSKVGSSDCSCSDCAEAMLEAYNEYLLEEGKPKPKSHRNNTIDLNSKRDRLKQFTSTNPAREYSREQQRINWKIRGASTFNRSPRFEVDKTRTSAMRQTCHRDHKHRERPRVHRSLQQQEDPDDICEYQPETIEVVPTKYDFSEAELRYYVDQKIKQNLKKHRHKEEDLKRVKEQEQTKKKLALAILDAERKRLIGEAKVETDKNPWNYQLEDEKKGKKQEKKEELHCHKIPIKNQTNSGMNRMLVEEIVKARLEEKKKIRQEEYRLERENKQAPETNPKQKLQKHDIHSPPKFTNKVTKKIQENAQKYLEKVKNQKLQKIQAQKLKESKLQALAAKAQKKLLKAKKVGVNDRSSFHSSIQNHSTFSQMKHLKEERQKQKVLDKEFQQQINPNRNQIHYQKQILENQEEGEEGDEVVEVRKPPSFSKQKSFTKSVSREKKEKEKSQEKSESDFSNRPSKITKEMREQAINEMEKSLNRRIKPRELEEEIEDAIADPNSKFYVWDMPLDDTQVKKIFDEAKIPLPVKSKNVSVEKKGDSEFRQEANRKIEENIKKKLKQKEKEKKQSAIEDKVKQKKEEIMKEYRKIKDMQTKMEKSNDSSQNATKSKTNIQSNKQLKSQFVSKLKQNQKDKPKGKQGTHPHIKQNQKGIQLSEEWYQQQYENKASGNLQQNEIFTDGDKKIFVLNSQMLAGVKHLKV